MVDGMVILEVVEVEDAEAEAAGVEEDAVVEVVEVAEEEEDAVVEDVGVVIDSLRRVDMNATECADASIS